MGGRSSKPKQEKKAPRASEVSDRDRAVLELKRQRDRLRQYRSGLETIISRESEVARALLSEGARTKAVMVLKKKKLQETLLRRAENQQLNVEQLLVDIESAETSQRVFAALSVGNEALKAIQKEMSVEDVEALMDDTAESLRVQEEMSSALSRALTEEDEADVEAEYARLAAAMEADEEREKAEKVAAKAAKQKQAQAAAVPATATKNAEAEAEAELDAVAALGALAAPSHAPGSQRTKAETEAEEEAEDEKVASKGKKKELALA